ncbi:MAG TPA: winged helix-turn-helix transcriptional regulator [Dehalococcoidia bacterium]|nr:winged helix-turn-helix transcriptional regulator [Dehalococcoidia bacterium]
MEHDKDLYRLKAELCKTLSNPERLLIINELRSGEKTVNDLAEVAEVNQSIVSRHLAILRNRGVVESRRQGINVYYSLSDPRMGEACDLVQQILLNQMEKNKELADRLIHL